MVSRLQLTVACLSSACLLTALIGCGSNSDSSIAHDLTTPEGAILSLEDAYRAEDIEAAVRCRDFTTCLLYTSPSPRDATLSRMPSSA